MSLSFARHLIAAASLSLLAPLALADGVSVRADHGDPTGAPFPSNRWTVFDGTQRTLRRVNLPTPDCTVRVSDCQDVAVLNTLDGFSTQPRISVPFTGDIDVATVNSSTVYLVNLGDTFTLQGFGDRVGINQIVWNPATKTLSFQSDELLQEHARYLMVVTDGVRDSRGDKIKSGGWGEDWGNGHAGANAEYGRDLRDGVQGHRGHGYKVVAASLFTLHSSNRRIQHTGQYNAQRRGPRDPRPEPRAQPTRAGAGNPGRARTPARARSIA